MKNLTLVKKLTYSALFLALLVPSVAVFARESSSGGRNEVRVERTITERRAERRADTRDDNTRRLRINDDSGTHQTRTRNRGGRLDRVNRVNNTVRLQQEINEDNGGRSRNRSVELFHRSAGHN